MQIKKIASMALLTVLALLFCVLIVKRAGYEQSQEAANLPQPSAPQDTADDELYAPPEADNKPSPEPVTEPEPEPTPEPTPEPEPEPEPELPDIDITEWQYRLVNTERLLESDYAPELTMLENGQYFDSRAVDALQSFIDGARDAGLTVVVSSSYRSYATQQYLFNNKVYQTGSEEAAARIVAIPGTSEHQLGLSADIVDGYYEYMNESLAETALAKWMYEHCWEYGFILRYPEDKQDITKIMFEPWHFRYVGVEAAQYIMENGLCLEEFVALYE